MYSGEGYAGPRVGRCILGLVLGDVYGTGRECCRAKTRRVYSLEIVASPGYQYSSNHPRI